MVRAVERFLLAVTEPELCMIYFMVAAAVLFCVGAWTIAEFVFRIF